MAAFLRACGSRGVSRALTSQGALLLLFSLALFASFRYETFLTPYNLMNHATEQLLAIVTLGMTVVILSGELISPWAPSLLWAASSQQCSPAGSLVAIVGGIASALGVVNGLLVSRARLQPFVVTLFTASAARGWRWHHRGKSIAGIISLGTCLAGQVRGPVPVPVHGCAPVFRSLVHAAQEPIRVAHVRGRRQRESGSWA